MKYQLSTHDYELISAYLDNQLSEKDRARFEVRLKIEPELQKELHEIQITRSLIHSLPRMRAPRNYYIKPETVPVRQISRLAPVFGIVSAVASILLVVVIFSSVLYKSRQPVAMAPAAPVLSQVQTNQPETARSSAPQEPPTETPPSVMMVAPKQQVSATSPVGTQETLEPGAPTPTTIYIYAYPPTGTPESSPVGLESQSQLSGIQCEPYENGGGSNDTENLPYGCPTPTSTETSTPTPSETPTPTPSETPTPTCTPTTSVSIQEFSVTTSPTPTETPTPTSTQTETPTPTSSATPTATEMPLAAQKAIPTDEIEAPAAGLTAPNASIGAGEPTTAVQDQASGTEPGTNSSFLNYLLLTVEISLASVAIIAGIIAIIFRARAGR